MVSCLMGDSTALASAIVRCCPKISLHLNDRPSRISIKSEIRPENCLFPRSRNCGKINIKIGFQAIGGQ